MQLDIEWKRQDRQIEFLRACGLSYPIDGGSVTEPRARIILYGGSAGGGKSDSLLMAAFIAAISFTGCNVALFRREYPQLEGPGGIIQRSHEMFSKTIDEHGKVYIAKWHGGMRRWTFINGSVVQFCHCKTEEDIYSYNSQQIDILMFDESTQFTEFQLTYLLTRNRATVTGLVPFCAMATNPGGVSHDYHLSNFIDVGEPEVPHDVEVQPGIYRKHMFIPAKLEDNKVLEDRNPNYRQTLESMPENIRRAMLDGDWSVFEGQYFKEFKREKHVVEPFNIPSHWRRFASMDWGFAAPCCLLWHTIDPSMGRIYTYREYYITQQRAAEVAKTFEELTGDEQIEYVKISPDAFQERGLGSKAQPGETVAEEFRKLSINVEPADNRRVLGWQRMREYMSNAPDNEPWWCIFNNCSNLIRTLPQMIHDKKRVEDISGDCEDHAPEAARYFLMSRPSPNEGLSFRPGEREAFGAIEEEDMDDYVGEMVSFYGL